jgi:RND family efflux transporter MFP subunit
MLRLRSILPLLATGTLVALAAWAGWYAWQLYNFNPWTRDARVRANIVTVAPDVAGPIVELNVRDNQEVRIGDVLFTVDQARYRLAVEQAQAALEGAKSTLEQRNDELNRRLRLTTEAISQEALNQAKSASAAAQAAYDQAEATLEVAKLNLARTIVHSPVNGHVTNLLLEKGDYATQGHAIVAIVDSDSFYVAAYFEETKLPLIRIGAAASIRLLGANARLDGKVESIARAITDRENAVGGDLIANVNPTFSWVRLAQRIPVRIAIEHIPPEMTLSAGMTATVFIER